MILSASMSGWINKVFHFVPVKKREDIFCLILIFLVIFLLYFPFMKFPFLPLWDDSNFIITNSRMAFTWENICWYFTNSFQDLYTPVTMVSLMADHCIAGKEPLLYHIHNLLLHIFCAGMLFLIFRRFGIRSFLAFAGCMLWALNPQKVESVIWITERKDVLSGAFAILSFYLFMRNAEKKTLPVFSTLFAVLALLTKPSTVPLPGVMSVFLFCAWGKRHSWKEYCKLLLLPLAACGIVLVISYVVTIKEFHGGLERNFLIPFHNLFWYPLTGLFPQTHPIYPPIMQKWYYYWKVFLGGSLMALVFIFWGRAVGVPWKKTGGWVLVTGGLMVPVLGMLDYTNFDYCDRYNYLVSIAVCGFFMLLLEKTLRKYPEKRDFIRIGLSVYCGIFFVMSYLYLPCWEDSGKLFAKALEDKVPSNVKLYTVGAHSAIVSGDTLLLRNITGKLLRDWNKYPAKYREPLREFCIYFMLHCCVLENDYHSALPFYHQAEKILRGKKKYSGVKFEKGYMMYLFRNMALTAAYHSMRSSALFYLEKYLAECERLALKNIGYYTSMALKAQLTNDKKLLRMALENIVRLDPGLTRYATDLEQLKKEEKEEKEEK